MTSFNPAQPQDQLGVQINQIRAELATIHTEIVRTRRRVPGMGTIAWGVAFGLILYTIIMFLLAWVFAAFLAVGANAALNRAIEQSMKRRQEPPATSPSEPPRLDQFQPIGPR